MITISATANTPSPLARNVWELITKHVEEQPQRTAIGTSDLRNILIYGELNALVCSVTAQLSSFGLRRGNTVALVSDSSVEFVLGLLAVLSAGGRVAPLNPTLNSTELINRGRTCQASRVIR